MSTKLLPKECFPPGYFEKMLQWENKTLTKEEFEVPAIYKTKAPDGYCLTKETRNKMNPELNSVNIYCPKQDLNVFVKAEKVSFELHESILEDQQSWVNITLQCNCGDLHTISLPIKI